MAFGIRVDFMKIMGNHGVMVSTQTVRVPRKDEVLSPALYLRVAKEQAGNIKQTKIVPPVLGRSGDFGKLHVYYRTSVLR